MKKLMLTAGFAGAMLSMGAEAFPCGDKLVVVGRGRPKRLKGSQAAAILVYADPAGSLPAALEQGHLRRDLERAGHRIRSVSTREELGTALETGSYDLLFADLKAAPSIEAAAQASRTRPTVLPTLYNPTAAERQAAEQQYHCVMKAPSAQKDYLAVVDQALAERAKQNPAPKKK
jgi:DNA-binding NtrC family response regulator